MSLVSSLPPSTAGPEQAEVGLAADVDMPEELIDGATASLLEGLAQARHPLAAELVLCEAFAAAEAAAPADADEQERLDALTHMLNDVIGQAETLASADALALLRVCSVLGPATTRSAARESAARLAATGLAERPWASRVGRPQMLRAWHYGDDFGNQSSVGVLFDYRGREHALLVLIDHRLGGGVKDCWLTVGKVARAIRDSTATRLDPLDTFFEDIDAAKAATLLGPALACEPCPEQADQIEDVDAYLYLTRARVEHLARLGGIAPAGSG